MFLASNPFYVLLSFLTAHSLRLHAQLYNTLTTVRHQWSRKQIEGNCREFVVLLALFNWSGFVIRYGWFKSHTFLFKYFPFFCCTFRTFPRRSWNIKCEFLSLLKRFLPLVFYTIQSYEWIRPRVFFYFFKISYILRNENYYQVHFGFFNNQNFC